MRIGIDLLGGDRPPEELREAAAELAPDLPKVELVAFGLPEHAQEGPLEFISCREAVGMDEHPLQAVRRKRDSSIAVGVRAVKEGKVDAFVSTGNTGALVATSTLALEPITGVERPGLLATVPSLTGEVTVIDIGGNINPRAEHLWQYARMGAAHQKATHGVERPRVGLLNIGTEALKGTRGVRDAHQLLTERKSSAFEFVGNIEGRDAFLGHVDVIVSAGFTGNIFLKTAEGISLFILDSLEKEFGEAMSPQVRGVLDRLNKKVNYAEYPGALICGVNGVVIKCHGFSSKQAVQNGIRGAVRLVENQFLQKLKDQLGRPL